MDMLLLHGRLHVDTCCCCCCFRGSTQPNRQLFGRKESGK
jgi:hypothetical protein